MRRAGRFQSFLEPAREALRRLRRDFRTGDGRDDGVARRRRTEHEPLVVRVLERLSAERLA